MNSFMEELPTVDQTSSETNSGGLSVGVPESSDSAEDSRKYSSLIGLIKEEFNRSKAKRQSDERRWLECYRNYRGEYGPTTQFTESEKSKVFIKITKTKVQAAYAQIVDVLFAGGKFPIGIEPSRLPVGVEEAVNIDPQAQPKQDSERHPQMDPQIAKLFGPKKDLLKSVEDKVESGIGTTPTSLTFEPAKDAAKKMEKIIHDQLDEAHASKSLRSAVFEMALFGTGVFKGPFAIDKEYPRWSPEGKYSPLFKTIPHGEYVSIWDTYPDSDARNMAECEKFIQRHRLSKSQLRDLKKRPMFRKKDIEKIILDGPNYTPEYWETSISEVDDVTTNERWEVLEYWGLVDAEVAKENGLKIPKEFKDFDQVQINAWTCGDRIIRLVFNPFTPARIPYHVVPYEINPYSFFGIGVAENMLDTQLLMNGFMRLAVDNAALSSNVVFEINEDYLVPGQTMEVFPGKIFRRQGGAPGKIIETSKIDNVSNEALMLFDKARQLSDEATGMPSYAHGMTGVQGLNRTAAGMSMLMGAASQNIKAVVRNIDDYLLAPLGKALFAFNMQFNFDKDFIGDLAVVAKGTESLMRNEVRSQKLLQLAQFAAPNPSMAPFIKWDYILREFASSLDLDEEKVVNDPRAAAIQAMQMKEVATLMGQPPQDPNAQGPQGGVPNPQDPTQNGGGNVGPGAAPEPGAEGFSGAGPQDQPQGVPQ